MRALILVLVGISVVSALTKEEWQAFKNKHGKRYHNETVEQHRHMTLTANADYIARHNKRFRNGTVDFQLGVNQYSDLSQDEYMNNLNGVSVGSSVVASIPPVTIKTTTAVNTAVPASFDWRPKGAVTPVKNQGQCGCCWTFSTTGGLEGQWFLKTGKLVSLSEQNLIDCASNDKYPSHGCKSGWMGYAYQYITDNGGIDTEESYPFRAENGTTCLYKPENSGASTKGYVRLPKGDEVALMKAVATIGPMPMAIDGSHQSFHHYSSGIYYEPECSAATADLTHGMLVVGYGTDPDGGDYWIVKNSWGTSWGENGYIRIARNRNNHCGIATAGVYPLV